MKMPQVKVLKKSENDVDASPTKAFFVEMLTRDIELKDAVLDLLDNCLDGVMRTIGGRKASAKAKRSETPYAGFHAEIEFDKDHFRITDDCGGMDKETLEKKAFRLGRPKLDPATKSLPTVGLYGIGMKRAIFKMGSSCVVTTRYGDKAYQVIITPEWLQDDKQWHLDLQEVEPSKLKKGTTIEIKKLHTSVSREFDRIKNKDFERDFSSMVGTHYSYIFHKGFSVKINGITPKPRDFNFRFNTLSKSKEKIAPYMFQGNVDNVDVELVVGLYRDVPSVAELEEMDEGTRFRRENAGWTIICNDRVVVFNDTDYLTGWGEAKVPKYHTQFVAITGVVRFSSSDPGLLPLTTTKRGINQNSALYAEIKNIMREGLKHFTDFTNKWKADPQGRKEIYKETTSVSPTKAMKLVNSTDWTTSRRFRGRLFIPKLPVPGAGALNVRTISFKRSVDDIRTVALYLFEEADTQPIRVGERCFDDFLTIANAERTTSR